MTPTSTQKASISTSAKEGVKCKAREPRSSRRDRGSGEVMRQRLEKEMTSKKCKLEGFCMAPVAASPVLKHISSPHGHRLQSAMADHPPRGTGHTARNTRECQDEERGIRRTGVSFYPTDRRKLFMASQRDSNALFLVIPSPWPDRHDADFHAKGEHRHKCQGSREVQGQRTPISTASPWKRRGHEATTRERNSKQERD